MANEYRCGECGTTYRGFPFHLFTQIIEQHKRECPASEESRGEEHE